MLDIKLIRAQPELVKKELAKVGFPPEKIDELLELDTQRRKKIYDLETLKAYLKQRC